MLRRVSWQQDHERIEERERPRAPEPEQPDPAAPLHELASNVGNRAFSATVAREASGVLPSGEVHPSVQNTISSTRGGGASLDGGVQDRFSGSLGDLSDVRVHTDDTADRLNRSVSARAFATGTDVYFAKGEYNPGSSSGDKLIAHELAHVVQQRGAPSSGPLTVSQPGDALETQADSVADNIA
jgi:Domain of unknown function (DUF4157)